MKIIKKDGRKEEFDEDKIKVSIENAARELENMLTKSDSTILVKDVINTLHNLRLESDTSSYEVRGIILAVLYKNKFDKIAQIYASN